MEDDCGVDELPNVDDREFVELPTVDGAVNELLKVEAGD